MSYSKRFKAIMVIYLCMILIIFTLPSCYGSINSHSSSNFGYRTQSKGVLDTSVCSIEETCEPMLKNATCFGTTLPYSFTSLALIDDSSNQFEVQDNLALFEGLKSVPRCWAVVQPLLCSLYMPKCENGSVVLPSHEMCRITRGPCRFVETIGWPSFLHCDNKKLFPSRCRNPLQEIKFNTTSKCIAPLIETDKPENWFHEVEGCGIQCQDPFFTKEEHEYHHYLTSILCPISFCLTFFTVLTFLINWKASNHFPNVIMFYINACLVFVYFGWLIQFFPNTRNDLVCNEDGTIRRQHPRAGQHLCTFTFFIIYYPLMAAVVWFVILSYTFHVTLRVSLCPKDIKKKQSYFHISVSSIPLVLTVAIMAMKEVDADSMSGICFVGYFNFTVRLAFLLAPISIAVVIADYFLISILYFLIKVRLNSEEFTNMRSRKKLRRMILKIGILATVPTFLVISLIGCNIYEYINKEDWSDSLRDYIVCVAMYSSQPYSNIDELHGTKCVLKSKPSVGVLHIQLVCLCLFGVISSVCVWNRTTIEAWKRFFFRMCSPAERNANLMKKHELIAKAFQRRHQLNQGHLSFSHSTHDDPVGMNLDMNSIASNDISSSWAMALPHLINRRNAVTGIAHFPSRHYSSASDISRQMSVDSYNQQNFDSLSMQINEHALRQQKRKTRKERERFLRANRIAPWCPGNRRGSDTSLQSSLMATSIAAALGAKVTKATSTGDLGVQASIPGTAIGTPMLPLPPKRKTVPREKVIPPFMHGMDGTHGMDGGFNQQLDCRNVRSSLGSTVSQRFTPGGFPNIMGGIIRPPMYGYDMMNLNIPFGYGIGNGMYPAINGMYPGYSAADFNYATYSATPYVTFGTPQSAEATYQYQHNLIPMQPRVESASESEYLPIIMSDSEYTDTGHRSYDEAQLMSACLMQQERLHAQAMAAATSELLQQPKPTLEPQACAKTQFLKRMNQFNSKDKGSGPSRPPSGKKSPHSEAPPPSPADSLKSLEIGDDDVFEEESLLQEKELPAEQHTEDKDASSSQTFKPNFRRATSLSKTCQAQPETLGLASKKSSSSLSQLPTKHCTPQKSVLKEKCLNAAESECLLSAKDDKENISR